MVYLVGKDYTRQSDHFLKDDKEYLCTLFLGKATTTHDIEGEELFTSKLCPSLSELESCLEQYFQGEISQVPPMHSAKKVQGQKLYKLARKGIEIPRTAVTHQVKTELLNYQYPHVSLKISCSKGCYIRSIARDLGEILKCGAHLISLQRTRSGSFHLKDCHSLEDLESLPLQLWPFIF